MLLACSVAERLLYIPAAQLLCAVQIYRNFEFGKLMKLIMLDTRIIGAHTPCIHITTESPRTCAFQWCQQVQPYMCSSTAKFVTLEVEAVVLQAATSRTTTRAP